MPCTPKAGPGPVAEPSATPERARAGRPRLDPRSVLGLPMFEGLPTAQVARQLAGASVETRTPRTLLFHAGDRADAFFILLGGRVKLVALTVEGRESIVEVIRPVSSFAEAAMFASGVYPVSAETIEACEIVRIGAAGFLAGLREDPELARRMLGALFRWNRRLDHELRMMKEITPIRRMIDYLLGLAPEGDGAAVFELPVAKSVIASRLGMEPETLSRVLARLRKVGVVSRGRSVEIADRDALRRYGTLPPPAGPARC